MMIKNGLIILFCLWCSFAYSSKTVNRTGEVSTEKLPEKQINKQIEKKTKDQKGLVLNAQTPIYTAAKPGEPLYKAVMALQRDMRKVLGGKHPVLPLEDIETSGVVIVNQNENKQGAGSGNERVNRRVNGLDRLASGQGPGMAHFLSPLEGREAHRVFVTKISGQPQILAQGADMRGAIYAVYTFSKKILGVPALWYFSSWAPGKTRSIKVPFALRVDIHSPAVRYRAWFPNDMDLFSVWRKRSKANDQLWLETALRLKLNTIEWFDGNQDYKKPYSVSRTTKLISDYGLINTSHHHSPLNASFSGWDNYWKEVRDTTPPKSLLSNEKYLVDFWRYNVACVTRSGVDMLWVLGFRGNGDHPFWYTFKDAPASMQKRGEVIDHMVALQRKIVQSVAADSNLTFRTIYYDELSDLLARGFLHPPTDPRFIRTYVAARRDHYPNTDVRELKRNQHLLLGYYFNYQFTSTGSHLTACEGPWKMEKNFQYVEAKSDRPLAYSVVNAGNIREFVMELSANAAMMWQGDSYTTDDFLLKFCQKYYGSAVSPAVAKLYQAYYHAFWHQKKSDLAGFDRQYIFQDLRYRRAISEIAKSFGKPLNMNPLTDIAAEQVKGRTYRIVPEDNGTNSQIQALIKGTKASAVKFKAVAWKADQILGSVAPVGQSFFKDNLQRPALYMYHLNSCLFNLCKAYTSKNASHKAALVKAAIQSLYQAQNALKEKAHGHFTHWYQGDRIFGFEGLYRLLGKIKIPDVERGKK